MHNEGRLRALLTKQHGLVTTRQWVALGFTKAALARRAQRGDLVRILPTVYRSVLVPESHQQRAHAAVLWAGEGAVSSHLTAARLWGVSTSEELHVWVPPTHSARSSAVVVHRGEIARNDRRVRDRVALTSPARTLVDVAGLLDQESLEGAAEDMLRRGLTTPMSISRCLEVVGSRPGVHLLRALLADRGDRSLEFRLEVKLWRLLRKAGFRPVRQFEVSTGTRSYRLDFAWPVLKVGVEGDGFASHGGALSFERDRLRLADLTALGWRIVPVTWKQCTSDPDRVIETVRAALMRAA